MAQDSAACQSVEKLLEEVNKQLNDFETRKLPELKAELDAFVKKKGALVDEYERKYSQLRDLWCTQHQLVENLYHSLKCAFPGQDWKAIVAECVCEQKHKYECLEQKIERRRRCCQGERERSFAKAKASFDKAKVRLDAVLANAQKIEAELTENAKLIKQIQGLVPGPSQAVALFLFWFQLLPSDKRLMPKDVSPECAKFADEENATTLCADIMKKPCEEDDNSCTPPAKEEPSECDPPKTSDRVPWLVAPEDYPGLLDCAWEDYRKAKQTLAVKEADFKQTPDDLAALDKALGEKRAGLEKAIKDCLMEHKPDDKCCANTAASN